MKLIIYKKQRTLVNICIVFICIIIYTHYLKSVYEDMGDYLISYAGYLFWLVLLGYVMLYQKKMQRRWMIFAVALVINGLIGGLIYGEFFLSSGLLNFHQCLSFALAFVLVMGVDWPKGMDHEGIIVIMKVLVGLGILASLYACVVQSEHWVNVLRGVDRNIHSWQYISFFSQRNIFAGFCFICMIPAVYLLYTTKRKIYFACCIIFAFQIYITDSRAALFSTLLFVLCFLYFNSKSKVLLIITICVLVCSIVFATGVDSSLLISRFSHSTSEGTGSGEMRLSMWMMAISKIFEENAFITGFGMGAASEYISRYYDFGSFHNAFIDVFFDGGIVQLAVYVYAQVCIFKRIAEGKYLAFKNIMMAAFLAYCFYSLLESGAMLFSVRYFSIITTILFAIIPQYYIQKKECEKEQGFVKREDCGVY